jgi:transglutaminase-like putative cysteine protease
LHEFVPEIDPDEPVRVLARARGRSDAVVYAGELVAAPEGVPAGPAMSALPGDSMFVEEPGRRSAAFAPDRTTHLDGRLDYYEGFTPSISPFKRLSAFDAVVLGPDGRTPVLVVADGRTHEVPVEDPSAPPPDARPRDRFWGQVRADFVTGGLVPLPSVSPESRILGLSSEPAVALRVERDGAGNYFLAALGAPPPVPVEVTFLTDAPRAYFGVEVPRVPAASLAAEVTPLASSVRDRALAFASELGVRQGTDLRTMLHALTGHFRAFVESVEPPRDTGDVYLDLARGKKGICRHRAYAFVVTAQALGVPARFVQNEAHSWVEVKLPGSGWMRIDLGGAADGLTAHGTHTGPIYEPPQSDRLPRPTGFARSDARVGGDARSRSASATGATTERWLEPEAPSAPASVPEPEVRSAAPGSSVFSQAPADRRPVRIRLDQRRAEVLRGRKLAVTGRVEDAVRGGVAGLRVEVSLASKERPDRLLLGVTVSGEGGYFRGAFGVPPDLAVGDYRLLAVTPGDVTHLPATTE